MSEDDQKAPASSGNTERAHTGKARLVVALVLGLALIAGLTIGTVAYVNRRADVKAAERAEAREKAEDERRAKAEAEALQAAKDVHVECSEHFTGLSQSLGDIDARLDVGLSYDEYTDALGDASVVYNRIDFDALQSLGESHNECLDVGVALEKAFNKYNRAATRWGNCIEDFDCDTDSLNLSGDWGAASLQLEEAEKLLDALDPEHPSFNKQT